MPVRRDQPAQVERHARLFRNGRNQVVRIPPEFELPGDEALIPKEGDRLIVEPVMKQNRLLEVLATLEELEEEFPQIEDPSPADDVQH